MMQKENTMPKVVEIEIEYFPATNRPTGHWWVVDFKNPTKNRKDTTKVSSVGGETPEELWNKCVLIGPEGFLQWADTFPGVPETRQECSKTGIIDETLNDLYETMEYTQIVASLIEELRELLHSKGEYYGGKNGQFWNFLAAEELTGMSLDMIFLARVAEKVARVGAILQGPIAQNIHGTNQKAIDTNLYLTWEDIAGYAILRMALYKSKEEK